MMPKMNGLDVLKNVRTQSTVPIIMLTAKGDDIDRIIGLEMGADDYVPKPCTPRELLARINAILRRAQHSNEQNNAPNSISVSDVVLYPAKRQASIKDTPLELTSTEFNLLEVLMRHAGQVVSKETLSIEHSTANWLNLTAASTYTSPASATNWGDASPDSNCTRLRLPVC